MQSPPDDVIDVRARSEIKYAINELREAAKWIEQAHTTALDTDNPSLAHELKIAQSALDALRRRLIVARRP